MVFLGKKKFRKELPKLSGYQSVKDNDVIDFTLYIQSRFNYGGYMAATADLNGQKQSNSSLGI